MLVVVIIPVPMVPRAMLSQTNTVLRYGAQRYDACRWMLRAGFFADDGWVLPTKTLVHKQRFHEVGRIGIIAVLSPLPKNLCLVKCVLSAYRDRGGVIFSQNQRFYGHQMPFTQGRACLRNVTVIPCHVN